MKMTKHEREAVEDIPRWKVHEHLVNIGKKAYRKDPKAQKRETERLKKLRQRFGFYVGKRPDGTLYFRVAETFGLRIGKLPDGTPCIQLDGTRPIDRTLQRVSLELTKAPDGRMSWKMFLSGNFCPTF